MQRCSRYLTTLPAAAAFSQPSRTNLNPLRKCRPSIGYILPRHGSTSSSIFSSTTSSPIGYSKSVSFRTPENAALLGFSLQQIRLAHSGSSSSSKWLARQSTDRFTREAKVANLKSRAAFKLLQINEKHRIFRPGMTVVDLGYAPGSWSQVAIDLVRPGKGRVIGVDVIPLQPPKGVNGIQGDFLSPDVQARVREFVRDEGRGRMTKPIFTGEEEDFVVQDEASYIEREKALAELEEASDLEEKAAFGSSAGDYGKKCVDVVLSDMSAPWELTSGLYKNSISNPYRRMMNTTGNKFRDHAGSMDLCRSALYFSYETLKVGGSFVCKFYQGGEDKIFEKQLKALFQKVHREKPESSRNESRESFFVAMKRLPRADPDKVFDEGS